MRDPYIAVDAATDLKSHARALRRSWESGRSPRPVIEASWRRTVQAGIDPEHPNPRQAFTRDELEDRRDASGLRDCVDVLRSCLGAFAQDAEHVMVVVDADCRVLWLEGHPIVRRAADGIAFEEGMYWTEGSVGTNAIGTAMAIDHAVQVFSAEHFSATQHPWWCSAAPIHDPLTQDLLGVVDLSGPMHTAHPHSLAVVTAAARLAEEYLRGRSALRGGPRLRVLGAQASLGGRPLSLRHAEILCLLTLHPDGLTSEALTRLLYGHAGKEVSTRAEVSRLRKLVPDLISARPYRLDRPLPSDLEQIERALTMSPRDALRAYKAPLLPDSHAPGVLAKRRELEAALRRAAMAGAGPGALDLVYAWLQTSSGRDDADALARFVRGADARDARRPLAAARLRALQLR